MFRHYNDDKFKKIIDEFILSSSDNESSKYILRNIDFEAFKIRNFFLSNDIHINPKKCYSEQKITINK